MIPHHLTPSLDQKKTLTDTRLVTQTNPTSKLPFLYKILAQQVLVSLPRVDSQSAAADSIADIKAAINVVSTNRANLGGLQNRLEHTINNLSVTEENMTAAEARIRDVDMAKEMMAYTKNNVLTQAAQAMLAQANTQPQSVLQLLQ